MKAGYATTEFWITLFGSIVSLAVALGLVPVGDVAALNDSITKAVTAAFGLSASAWMVVQYIQGRVALKTQHLNSQATSRY